MNVKLYLIAEPTDDPLDRLSTGIPDVSLGEPLILLDRAWYGFEGLD